MVDDIEERCGPTVDLIHVMDSEADWYDLLEHMPIGTSTASLSG